ncbi:hypothetical protein ACJIZ3_007586 [Penstemon smallii]|uniref:Uncharacterized protein n=1 Tax=Penstemon smallii TaxID=265156 RepID=A0ABD3T7E7_9LAMI
MDEKEEEQSTFPKLKLPFLPLPQSSMHSPEHPSSGTATPPLRTLASVPFKWEEEPGKPLPCTDIIIPEPTKCLELPPCRINLQSMDRITKTPSPTTVLDGPCNVGRPKFSSFRFFKEAHDSYYESSSTSTDRDSSSSSFSPEGGVLLGKSNGGGGQKGKGCFRKFNGGSFRFSSSSIADEKIEGKIRKKGSFSHDHATNTKSNHLWGAIYEGFKQVIPWKSSKKSKK